MNQYVAVVFFHGIGQQRNYESTAELVEGVSEFVFARSRAGDPEFPLPRLATRTRREQIGDPKDGQNIVYIQADYGTTRVRFYEGYWAPATVLGTTARAAFWWLMSQIAHPLGILGAPWRSYARLRRGDLIRMPRSRRRRENTVSFSGDVKILTTLYQRFASRYWPRNGQFSEFLGFIRKKAVEKDRERLVQLARDWRVFHYRNQIWNLLVLTLFGASVLAGAVLLLLGALKLLAFAGNIAWISELKLEAMEPSYGNAAALVVLLLSAIGVSAFVRDFVGDIQQFVSYEEAAPLHERRAKVLAAAEKTLRHVLGDPLCERVVIVAHSLGTAVAFDAILRLRGANIAANPAADDATIMKGPLPLERVQHFITCGSPIEKIHYFFAALRSATRSYEALIEELRGDIGSVPFSKSGKQPHVHWINFWDRGDPISGPIEMVAGYILREQRVDNVQIASYLWPDPAGSHAAYFKHRDPLGTIFRAAFQNGFSFAKRHEGPGRPVRQWLGPGRGSRLQQACLLLIPAAALGIIWAATTWAVPGATPAPFWALGLLPAILIAGAIVQKKLLLHQAPVAEAAPQATPIAEADAPPPIP